MIEIETSFLISLCSNDVLIVPLILKLSLKNLQIGKTALIDVANSMPFPLQNKRKIVMIYVINYLAKFHAIMFMFMFMTCKGHIRININLTQGLSCFFNFTH